MSFKKKYGSKTSRKKKVIGKSTKVDNKEEERWKIASDEYDNYEISNFGRIRNINTGTIRKPSIKNGYYYCGLEKNKCKRIFRVHRLVATKFVENSNPNKNKIVNHIDGDKLNNHYTNLEWTTAAGNNKHAADNGLTAITKKKVSQYVGDELIAQYESVSAASDATGINMSRIVEVCGNSREEYYGFVFKYTDYDEDRKEIDPEEEGFKQIKSFPNYWINKRGRIYSKPFKKFMKLNVHSTGCLQIQLTKRKPDGEKGQIKRTVLIHNLVAIYFLGKRPKEYNCIRHKDNDKTNNFYKNLKWAHVPGANPKVTFKC